MIRTAFATWRGSGLAGKGRLTTESAELQEVPFEFRERFGDRAVYTNPEELLAAAQAACFVMKLSFILNEAGYASDLLRCDANVKLENGYLSGLHLSITAQVPVIETLVFAEHVAETVSTCPISRVLTLEITYSLILNEQTI